MNITITVTKSLDHLGFRTATFKVIADKLTSEVFSPDGKIRPLDDEYQTFKAGSLYEYTAELYVRDDKEIQEIIDRIVGVYKRVMAGKEDWTGERTYTYTI